MTMTRFERWSVWLTTAGTLVTGVVYWWMKDLMTSSDPWAVVNHPLQPWVLKAHILIAPFLVFSVGMISVRHVWRHFSTGVRKGRRSGVVAAAGFAVLVVSGYLLQVLTAETLLRLMGWTHLGLGVLYSLAVGAHWPATRPSATSARIEPSAARPTWPESVPGVGRAATNDRRRRAGRRSSAASG